MTQRHPDFGMVIILQLVQQALHDATLSELEVSKSLRHRNAIGQPLPNGVFMEPVIVRFGQTRQAVGANDIFTGHQRALAPMTIPRVKKLDKIGSK